MKFRNPYWTNLQKIQMLQRWILFHSYVYYELNENYVEDSLYDKNAHMLADLMEKYKDLVKSSRYHKVFKGYDGNSGYFLIQRLKQPEHKELLEKIVFDVNIFRMAYK